MEIINESIIDGKTVIRVRYTDAEKAAMAERSARCREEIERIRNTHEEDK